MSLKKIIFDKLDHFTMYKRRKLQELNDWKANHKNFLLRLKVISLAMLGSLAFVLLLLGLFVLNTFLITGTLTLTTPVIIVGIIMAAYLLPCSALAAEYLINFVGWIKPEHPPEQPQEPLPSAANQENQPAEAQRIFDVITGSTSPVSTNASTATVALSGVAEIRNTLSWWEKCKNFFRHPRSSIISFFTAYITPHLKKQKKIWTFIGIVSIAIILLILVGIIPGGFLGFLIVAIPVDIMTWLAGMELTFLFKDVTMKGLVISALTTIRDGMFNILIKARDTILDACSIVQNAVSSAIRYISSKLTPNHVDGLVLLPIPVADGRDGSSTSVLGPQQKPQDRLLSTQDISPSQTATDPSVPVSDPPLLRKDPSSSVTPPSGATSILGNV